MSGIYQDLRYAVRTLRKSPGFAIVIVLTLALGIGVNSAIFALVDATILRPLPFPNSERIVMIWERTESSARASVSPLNLRDWRDRSRAFEAIGGFVPNVGGMVISGADGTTDTVPRQWVTAGFFDAVGVRPIAGRTFLSSDDYQGRNVVVLSEAFWRARFSADPRVVGSDIRLDGLPWTVVGVVPNEAQVLPTSVWALFRIERAPAARRGFYGLHAIGRFKAGVTIEAAHSDIKSVADALAREFPKTNAGRSVALEPLRDVVIGTDLRRTSMLFLGVVGFVLLICCANIASLLLTRATGRTRELTIRSALGADRFRLIRQLLVEMLLLAAIGGVIGLAIGRMILNVAPAVIPQGLLPPIVTLTFDARLVDYCAATVLLAAVALSLAPAWLVTALPSGRMDTSATRTTTGSGGRVRSMLVVGEIAAAVLLLFAAGLLLRTLLAVEGVDRGYRAERVLTMILDPLSERYPTDASELRFYEAVETEVASLPGVRDVGWATTLPLGASYQGESFFEIVGDPPPEESQRPTADYQIVSPNYFTALDLPIVAGRGFDDRDAAGSSQVCIVNEAFARGYLQGRSPIGVRIAIQASAQAKPVIRQVVGVARQVKSRPDETEEMIQIYVPLAQDTPGDIFMLVTPEAGPAHTLAPAVRAAIARVDKEQLVSVRDVMTLDDVVWERTARHRFRAVLVMAFAGLALVLAMVGLAGILAYSVQQRVRDFGVRRALGAATSDVLRLVLGSAARLLVTGAVIGLVLSLMVARLLTTMLFGVQPMDVMTFASVVAVLTLTAFVAVAGPALRATKVDPLVALRYE